MKRIFFAALLLTLVVGLASAQSVSVVSSTWLSTGKHYANSAGDSITGQPVAMQLGGTQQVFVPGQLPDSIKVTRWATTDTIAADIDFGATSAGGNYVRVYVDSVKAGAWKSTLVPKSAWSGVDIYSIAILQRASGASVVAANNKVWVRVDRYFTVPPK